MLPKTRKNEGCEIMDILLYAALEQRTQNQQLEELLREMVIRIKENTKEIKRLTRKQGGLK